MMPLVPYGSLEVERASHAPVVGGVWDACSFALVAEW